MSSLQKGHRYRFVQGTSWRILGQKVYLLLPVLPEHVVNFTPEGILDGLVDRCLVAGSGLPPVHMTHPHYDLSTGGSDQPTANTRFRCTDRGETAKTQVSSPVPTLGGAVANIWTTDSPE